jgi:hypothetical protein
MNKLKEAEKPRKLKRVPFTFVPGGRNQDVSIKEELWQETLQELQAARFTTVEAAIEAVVEQVTRRMSLNESNTPGIRAFLTDLLSTDAGIRAELEEIFKIR